MNLDELKVSLALRTVADPNADPHTENPMDKVFEALASTPRRKILAYLSATEMSAGEIAERFDMSKPSLSNHLKILEGAGLITGDKRGQFIFYRLQGENLASTLSSFMQAVCPVSQGLKRESKMVAARKKETK